MEIDIKALYNAEKQKKEGLLPKAIGEVTLYNYLQV